MRDDELCRLALIDAAGDTGILIPFHSLLSNCDNETVVHFLRSVFAQRFGEDVVYPAKRIVEDFLTGRKYYDPDMKTFRFTIYILSPHE